MVVSLSIGDVISVVEPGVVWIVGSREIIRVNELLYNIVRNNNTLNNKFFTISSKNGRNSGE